MQFHFTKFFVLTIFMEAQCLEPQPEDAKLNFTELGEKYGHRVKEYDVVTEDEYILKLFHIPGEKKGSIILIHGITDSADTFILRGKLSLAITLADKGHDVWAGNTRGNKYGRRHKYLNPDKDPAFWNFSFHEAGYYDMAATIDFVLNATNENDVRVIGHSQGTTATLVLTSTRPEYNEKIKVFIALAPAAFLNHIKPPLSTVVKFGPAINVFLKSLRIEEILRDGAAASDLIKLLCSQGILSYELCFVLVISPFAGLDPMRIEPEFFQVVIGHYPAGTNRKSLVHYDQVALKRRFAMFDHGEVGNLRRYGLLVPPSYDLSKVTTNVALIVGKNDGFSRVRDVDILRSMLPNVVFDQLLEPPMWNHLDFVWANDMDVFLYPYILMVIEKYN